MKNKKNLENVCFLPGDAPIDPVLLLQMAAEKWGLKEVVILGLNGEDDFVYGSSSSEKKDILFLLELCRQRLGL